MDGWIMERGNQLLGNITGIGCIRFEDTLNQEKNMNFFTHLHKKFVYHNYILLKICVVVVVVIFIILQY